MSYYRIPTWNIYQHYKKRSPPWIKLHRNILTDRTWVTLDNDCRVLAIACMLIAAETENKIPADPNFIKRRAYLIEEPNFSPLIACGFLELIADASGRQANVGSESESESEKSQRHNHEGFSKEEKHEDLNGSSRAKPPTMRERMNEIARARRSRPMGSA